MKFLVITQVFWPDTASTAQHLTDFVLELKERGHEVKVLTSKYAYEDNKKEFPRSEVYNGVIIHRINNVGLGKKSAINRLIDFASFNILMFFNLLFISRKQYDVIIGMTSPPLVSYFGILIARLKKIKFFYWTMDLQPELAIASGLIREKSLLSRILTRIGNVVIRKSDKIVALDNYMKKYLINRGAPESRVNVIPVWPVLENVYSGERLENPFRIEHGFGDKLIIMYSGNHAYVHPLDTLLASAQKLREEKDILFVFIGEGVRKKDVTNFKQLHQLENIIQLPYQPRSNIHNSLGAADLQVVIMGKEQVGFTHPNKIYGAMLAGKPIIYIGPLKSHITDILGDIKGNIEAEHGAADSLVNQILNFKNLSQQEKDEIGLTNQTYARENFHPEKLKRAMCKVIEA